MRVFLFLQIEIFKIFEEKFNRTAKNCPSKVVFLEMPML